MILQTHTGAFLNPADLKGGSIACADIAHSLAWQCRYNGHLHSWYSVAQHCVAMSRYAEKWYPHLDYLDFACLMHDAPEMITGDIPSPVKEELPELRLYEEELLATFFKRFKIPYEENLLSHVKELDKAIVPTEIALFLNRTVDITQIDRTWAEAIGPAQDREAAELDFIRQYAKMYEKYAIKELENSKS